MCRVKAIASSVERLLWYANCSGSSGGCFTFQFLPISRQKQNGRVIRFAERWAGEGLVCVPERSVTMVEYTIFVLHASVSVSASVSASACLADRTALGSIKPIVSSQFHHPVRLINHNSFKNSLKP